MPTTTPTKFKRTMKRVLHLLCEHCNHGWYPIDGVVPKVCPNCKYILEEAEQTRSTSSSS